MQTSFWSTRFMSLRATRGTSNPMLLSSLSIAMDASKSQCQQKTPSEFAANFPRPCVAGGPIRINVVNVGGEFGGKGDASDLPVAYFLAQESDAQSK